jgi:hypothetical protein
MSATAYSFVSTREPVTRPLCVFQVLFKGLPVPSDIDGEPIEHGSHRAADDHARRLADMIVTARSNFAVKRVWL